MKIRIAPHVLAVLFATAAIAADSSAPVSNEKPPTQSACLNQCQTAEGRCSREVRDARRDCERIAANGGRNVFTGRNNSSGIDYGRFCSYFAAPEINCGSGYDRQGCQARLSRRHGICLEAMQNVAALRYDCFRSARDVNNQCRAELADCRAECR